jgi:hypothetical protein
MPFSIINNRHSSLIFTAMEHTAQIVAALYFAVNSATIQGLEVVEFVWSGVKHGCSDGSVPKESQSGFKTDRCRGADGSVPVTKGDTISGSGPLMDDDGQKIGDVVLSGTVLDGGLARVAVVANTIGGDVLSSRYMIMKMDDIIARDKKSLYLPFLNKDGLEEIVGSQSSRAICSTEMILGCFLE